MSEHFINPYFFWLIILATILFAYVYLKLLQVLKWIEDELRDK